MAKNSIADYSATAASNTDIQSVDIDEGCAPSGINNAIRELMADIAGELSPTADAQFAGVNYPAIAGIVESNANFIDACLVGPSVDGKAWAGKFENGSVWSSLMLATVETSGSDAEVNIWDLTTGTLASATPLATVTLTGATPTSIAASMGYVIVGTSDQGFHIVDPHDGAWAERTDGWPRSLTASTAPALSDNNVQSVNAMIAGGAPYDPRTGGSVPTFVIGLGATKDFDGIMDNGTVVAAPANTSLSNIVGVHNDFLIYESNTAGNTYYGSISYARDNASWSIAALDGSGGYPLTGTVNTIRSGAQQTLVGRSDGLISYFGSYLPGSVTASILAGNRTSEAWATAAITNSYNSGVMPGQVDAACVLAALANSATADRSGNSNTLTENGTVTEAAVETGAELMGYSGWSASNYLERAYDADFDFGTGDFSFVVWAKRSSGSNIVFDRTDTGGSGARFSLANASGNYQAIFEDSAAGSANISGGNGEAGDGAWHLVVGVNDQSGDATRLYVDGVLVAEDTAASLGDMDNGTAVLRVGLNCSGGASPWGGEIALLRIASSALSADQIRKTYEAEKGMFAANAKCLLQGASDAVLDARIDPLTGKYIVTQSDTQDIFDGLAIETERTIAAGGTTFEHGLLWGDGVAEVNDANLYASMPATDQRQINEMVRSMAAELPAGVDLSKAKAWLVCAGDASIQSSYNIESVSTPSTGRYEVNFGVPFKSTFVATAISGRSNADDAGGGDVTIDNNTTADVRHEVRNSAGSMSATSFSVAYFGELENE